MLKKSRSTVLALLTFFYVNNACCQDLAHYRIDYEDGLPSNEVYQTIQDNFGFIWIGCDAGLFRYDGFKFKEYSNAQLNSRSISNLKLDHEGNIWCQNFTGQILCVKNDRLKVFYDGSKFSSQYPSFTIDDENHVWVAEDSSITVFSSSGKKIRVIQNSFFPKKPGRWLALQSHGKRIIAVDLMSQFYSIDSRKFKIRRMMCNRDIGSRHIFCVSYGKLVLFSERNPVREYYKSVVKENQIICVETFKPGDGGGIHYFFKTIKNHSFMGTSNGLLYRLEFPGYNAAFQHSFSGIKISDIQLDREGNYWVSTLQDGIFVLPGLQILNYQSSNSILSDNNLSHLSLVNDQLYVGTYSGDVFSFARGKFEIYQRNTNATFRSIRKILSYKDKLITACGILQAPGIPVLHQMGSLNNIRDMIVLKDKLYFTTPDRTGYVDLLNKKCTVTILRKRGGKKLICDERTNTVYIACTDGLFEFSNGSLKELKFNSRSIFSSDLGMLGNKLWVGTMNEGVLCKELSAKSHSFHRLKGVLGGHIRALCLNGKYAWLATEKGLNRYELNTNKITLFNAQDGIDFPEINDIEVFEGKVYVATIRGLSCFPEEMKGTNPVSPKIKWVNIRVGNKNSQTFSNLDLDYNERDVVLQFQGTALRSRGAYFYEYRILNYNETWNRISGSSPSVTLTGLPGGNYVFEVRAVNEDNVISANTLRLPIHVSSPFYLKWWFISLVFLAVTALLIIIFNYRVRFVKKQAEARNQLVHSQLTALKAQMNPHFMYNTLSSIQDFIWQNDIKNSNYYLSKFSLLMRKILDASDISRISLNEEIEILNLYLELEQLRFGDSFQFSIKVDNKIDEHRIFIPAMIIQPFVENAIKHGLLHKNGKKDLEIAFVVVDKELHCTIKDNGIGRAKAEEIRNRQSAGHRSFATTATKKRIDLLSLYDDSHYKCEVTDLYSDDKPSGTQVELTLPYHDS